MSPALRRLLHILLGTVLALATAGALGAAGVAVTMGQSFAAPPPDEPPQGWPAARTAPAGRTVVAVALGATGSVVSDVLAPYEVFALSPAFFVYTVSERRVPVALSGGLSALPDHTLDEVTSGSVPAPDVIVVPAVVDPGGGGEAALRGWIARQAARGARVLGVCAGAELLAASGVLDGRQATSHWAVLGSLRDGYPQVGWQRGRRYVQDGPILTTAGVASGVVGALRLVELLAGTAEADRVGGELAFPGWSRDATTVIDDHRYAVGDLAYGLAAAEPWLRPTIAVGLADGIGEIDTAAAFEVYSGTSFTARAIPVAATRTVTTRHGLVLVATPTRPDIAEVERLVVPGARTADGVDPRLADWAAARGLAVDLPHAGQRAGEFSFDPVLRDLAERTDRSTARATSRFTEYPFDDRGLRGGAWPARPTVLAVLTMVVSIVVGLLPAALRRLIRARRRTASTTAA